MHITIVVHLSGGAFLRRCVIIIVINVKQSLGDYDILDNFVAS